MTTQTRILDERLREAETLISDRKRFIETYFFVQNKRRELVRFRFNPLQQHLHEHKKRRNVICKARQVGCSTYILADMLFEAITVPNTICVCISHEAEATKRLFGRLKLMYDLIPEDKKPEADHQSAMELTFPSIGSRVYIGTARAPAFGRGDTVSILHLSEPAHYPKEAQLGGITQAVPMTDSTTVYYESTPNGRGNIFFDLYQAAKNGEGGVPLFYPWWWCDEYLLPAGSEFALEDSREEFTPTDEEQQLMVKHGLSLEQIRWRRAKSRELELVHQSFKQEYPENDVDCWLSGALAVFNPDKLGQMLSMTRPHVKRWRNSRIWKTPLPGKYLIGVDPAQGLPTSDYTAAVVLDSRTLEHVATLRARIPLDDFSMELADLGHMYNNALIVVERLGHAETIFSNLHRLDYSNIYFADDKREGWPTSPKTRPYMIDELASMISSGGILTYDEEFVEEAMNFQFIDGKAQAPLNGHDDILFAMMVALMVRGFYSLTSLRRINVRGYGPSFL